MTKRDRGVTAEKSCDSVKHMFRSTSLYSCSCRSLHKKHHFPWRGMRLNLVRPENSVFTFTQAIIQRQAFYDSTIWPVCSPTLSRTFCISYLHRAKPISHTNNTANTRHIPRVAHGYWAAHLWNQLPVYIIKLDSFEKKNTQVKLSYPLVIPL